MKAIFHYRGTQIHPRDQNLVFQTLLSMILFILLPLTIFFYLPLLSKINLKTVSWPTIHSLPWSFSGLIISSIITFLVSLIIILLILIRFPDQYRKLIHRQKIARMFMTNNWYESETRKNDGFFKDLDLGGSKERISRFPRVYYRLKNGLIHVQVEIVMSPYQDQLIHLEKKLESGLYCEIVDKILHDSFVEYTLLYDTIGNRISIEHVKCQKGAVNLMNNVAWEYDVLPHMLIAGGTGGGKTYFILTLIQALIRDGNQLTILDPKNSDLADLTDVIPDVHYEQDDMIAAVAQFYQEMMERNKEMKKMAGYQTGNNYAALGLPAHFLVFDEYVAFMDMIGREAVQVMSKLKQIVMLGRQSGFFLILACQRPDAKYLGDGIRDQFMFRAALGRMSDLGYTMMFGETDKDFFLKPIKGRGYVDTGISVISEFYTPLVPKGYDFLGEIDAAYQSNNKTL
ncbi:ATP-binding protein [Loigolactobacillus backii]|nr:MULTISPECIES: FtsK/SpoIIIE domain-containing protein [Lactobacillaceae]MCH4163806.1 ATP-binding protein [Lentilactobacillus diolivorans]AVK64685.1 ATP-binding protein [Lactobacillus sp. CBA3606]MCI2031687.1 ATP-binding protein [Limosilactobacillus sp.]MCT3575273.1 ATP-binding protein [Levilactobacillus brevis]MDN7144831.1 FtsK/SpoIIIE domain-containing protein [Liquorilactobacillus mali]